MAQTQHPDFDAVVIGAGAVGLACAAALAGAGQSVLVLEAGDRPGEVTTARNSEVIHAGLYYDTGSLKHRLCVEGRRLLYAFLDRTGGGYRKCGKLIVATGAEEEETLAGILERGRANGVEGLRPLTGAQVQALEPEVSASMAVLSAETGIFDSHDYVMRLIAGIEANGGHVALRTPFLRAACLPHRFTIQAGGAEPVTLTSTRLVNAAGLYAPELARQMEGLAPATVPAQRLSRGSYFRMSGPSPFSRLIYPVPVDGWLGIHATIDMTGALRFGPDVEWLPPGTQPDAAGYGVDPDRAASFHAAIRRYWPGLPDGRLEPDYSGLRPKLSGPGAGFTDFRVDTEGTHGIPGLVNLFGIESPGLTSSLAIGRMVRDALA